MAVEIEIAPLIAFPFRRGIRYPVSELNTFLNELNAARKQTPDLTDAIRARSPPWAKLWCEELFPVKLFIAGGRLPPDTEFRLTAEGAPVDVELHSREGITRIQITLGYPDWDGVSEKARNPGYIASLERLGINQGEPVFLGGRIEKTAGGDISSEPRARSNHVDVNACGTGLRKTLGNKLKKADRYEGEADTLLIYFSKLRFYLDYADTINFADEIITETVDQFGRAPFRNVVLVDEDPLAYTEVVLK